MLPISTSATGNVFAMAAGGLLQELAKSSTLTSLILDHKTSVYSARRTNEGPERLDLVRRSKRRGIDDRILLLCFYVLLLPYRARIALHEYTADSQTVSPTMFLSRSIPWKAIHLASQR